MKKIVKIVVYTPTSHANKVRRALADSGCGHIGNYDSCSFSVRGVGQFRPLKGANPFIGKVEKNEKVSEERIETICPKKILKKVLVAIKEVHPYEEPAIDIYSML
ncbi:MAG: hypothetical protein UY05_C0058G0006 [Candidatus Peregrinibacteria bacterium GW2011_GWA2_47_7]|nr:MAG: hypothetical protein UY05_C0058G0006 [Candidatus Peregrinibacteria bacterium GW2011_GWA2_47_7]